MHKNYIFIFLTLISLSLSPNLVNGQENSIADKFIPGELIIKIKAGVDSLSIQSSLDDLELAKLASASRGNWILVGFDKNIDVPTKLNSARRPTLSSTWD